MVKTDIEKMYKNFTHSQKAALLLIALGKKWATELMRLMKKEEVKTLAFWISQMAYVPQELTERVIKEFYDQLTRKSSLASSGGKEYISGVLSGMMGEGEVNELFEQINEQAASEENEVFRILRRVDPEKLAAYFKHEQPQIVALMLFHLPITRTAKILSSFSSEMKVEVLMRMAKMNEIDPEITVALEGRLNANLAALARAEKGEKFDKDMGYKEVAEILNTIDKKESKEIIDVMVEKDFDLATSVKEFMLVFEDMLLLDNAAVQKVVAKTQQKELILAMKGASDEIRDKIFSNISKGQGRAIRDELAFMGPVKASDVKEAQQSIVNTIRQLEEEGVIIIAGKGGGESDVIA